MQCTSFAGKFILAAWLFFFMDCVYSRAFSNNEVVEITCPQGCECSGSGAICDAQYNGSNPFPPNIKILEIKKGTNNVSMKNLANADNIQHLVLPKLYELDDFELSDEPHETTTNMISLTVMDWEGEYLMPRLNRLIDNMPHLQKIHIGQGKLDCTCDVLNFLANRDIQLGDISHLPLSTDCWEYGLDLDEYDPVELVQYCAFKRGSNGSKPFQKTEMENNPFDETEMAYSPDTQTDSITEPTDDTVLGEGSTLVRVPRFAGSSSADYYGPTDSEYGNSYEDGDDECVEEYEDPDAYAAMLEGELGIGAYDYAEAETPATTSSTSDTFGIDAKVLSELRQLLSRTEIELPVDINDPYDLGLLLRHFTHHSELMANIDDPKVRESIVQSMNDQEKAEPMTWGIDQETQEETQEKTEEQVEQEDDYDEYGSDVALELYEYCD